MTCRFECGTVVANCAAVFTGPSPEAILEQVAKHARDDHGMDVPPVPAPVERLIRDNIRVVA